MASTTTLAAEGLREAMGCGMCLEGYDQDLRKPLILPCGHTFCRPCLVTLTASGPVLCPCCKAEHNVQVEALTVNYSLLSITPPSTHLEDKVCTDHKYDSLYWCCSCSVPLCSLCLYSGHPQGHDVKLIQVFVQEEKRNLLREIRRNFKATKDQKQKLKEDFNDLNTQMKELFRRSASLRNDAEDLNEILSKIHKSTDVTSILSLEKEVTEGKKDTSPSGNKRSTSISEYLGDSSATMHISVYGPPVHGKQSALDFRDGRLLLHSLSAPKPTTLSFQMPSEVFLELSVGDRRLGCVFINLWNKTYLAQQFLALCMGTMGPSLLGIKASDRLRNILVFRFGVEGENSAASSSPLLTNLEWKEPGLPEAAGFVTGIDETSTAFGICTKSNSDAKLKAPFGNVVAGLDVAREAFQYDPVTEVTVTHCGLVLPGLLQGIPQLRAITTAMPPPSQGQSSHHRGRGRWRGRWRGHDRGRGRGRGRGFFHRQRYSASYDALPN